MASASGTEGSADLKSHRLLTGAMVKGASLAEGVRKAVDFVAACARRSYEEQIPQREGVDFEPLMGLLTT